MRNVLIHLNVGLCYNNQINVWRTSVNFSHPVLSNLPFHPSSYTFLVHMINYRQLSKKGV